MCHSGLPLFSEEYQIINMTQHGDRSTPDTSLLCTTKETIVSTSRCICLSDSTSTFPYRLFCYCCNRLCFCIFRTGSNNTNTAPAVPSRQDSYSSMYTVVVFILFMLWNPFILPAKKVHFSGVDSNHLVRPSVCLSIFQLLLNRWTDTAKTLHSCCKRPKVLHGG